MCRSVPEPKRLQRVYRGLGAADILPVLPVFAEQYQAGSPVHGPVLRPPHLFRGIGVRHTLRRPQSWSPHMRYDKQPLDAQTAQDHRCVYITYHCVSFIIINDVSEIWEGGRRATPSQRPYSCKIRLCNKINTALFQLKKTSPTEERKFWTGLG